MILVADLFSRVFFPNVFARGPYLALRSNHVSSHPFSRKTGRSIAKYPKLKIHISEVALDSYEYMPAA